MKFDVVIVGGGPAGCAAAIALRKKCVSVAVISNSQTRQRPTETATARLKELLITLGADEAFETCEPCYGVTSSWGADSFVTRPSIVNPYGNAHFIHRNEFDAVFARIAKASDVVWFEDRVVRVRLSDPVLATTESQTFECKKLVIATGAAVSSARITRQKLDQEERLVCIWSCLRGRLPERLLYTEPADTGWWYLCPGRGHATYACLMTRPPVARDLKLAKAPAWIGEFQRTEMSRMLDLDSQALTVQVSIVGSMKLPKRFGPNWVAVGDSAMTFDPLASCGTVMAVDSAMRAAEAITHSNGYGSSLLEQYEDWGSNVFQVFSRQRELLYSQERLRRPTRFWQVNANNFKLNQLVC